MMKEIEQEQQVTRVSPNDVRKQKKIENGKILEKLLNVGDVVQVATNSTNPTRMIISIVPSSETLQGMIVANVCRYDIASETFVLVTNISPITCTMAKITKICDVPKRKWIAVKDYIEKAK